MSGTARRAFAILAVALLMGASAPVWAGEPVAEPEGYRLDDYRKPVPATLRGARAVSPAEAFALWKEGAAIFVDVLPRAPKPASLPPGTVWRDIPRASIPRAVWLPNVGYGRLNAEVDAYFRRNLEALTAGDKTRPLVFFCQANCWMSWNAAKRAREEYGYSSVIWFPDGTDGWPELDAPLVNAEPRP